MKLTRKTLRGLIMEVLSEHRIKPDIGPNFPMQHIDKMHSLIDSGDHEMARSLIDAFDGNTDYVDNYIAYSEVGDLEKLGNKAADMISTLPKDIHGFSKMADMAPVYDMMLSHVHWLNQKP